MRLALYQPDIPQNTGTILRLAACLGVGVDIIGPSGFDISDKALRRAGLDYLDTVELCRHAAWEDFVKNFARGHAQGRSAENLKPGSRAVDAGAAGSGKSRLILLTTGASTSYLDFNFTATDTLLLGRESAGVPQLVHDSADARLAIPLRAGMRSLNIAIAAAIGLSEALRQSGGFSAR